MLHMIVKKYKETKLGVLISDKNKRNTKDPTKLKN
jgi:ABC-type lipopolysaccharide export system ATPase subunit